MWCYYLEELSLSCVLKTLFWQPTPLAMFLRPFFLYDLHKTFGHLEVISVSEYWITIYFQYLFIFFYTDTGLDKISCCLVKILSAQSRAQTFFIYIVLTFQLHNIWDYALYARMRAFKPAFKDHVILLATQADLALALENMLYSAFLSFASKLKLTWMLSLFLKTWFMLAYSFLGHFIRFWFQESCLGLLHKVTRIVLILFNFFWNYFIRSHCYANNIFFLVFVCIVLNV